MKIDGAGKNDIKIFITKHFIETALPDEPVIDQDVLVYYHDAEGANFGSTSFVRQRYLEFDIYVKKSVQYNATDDRMQRRDKLIFERLKYLLTKEKYTCNMRYECIDDFELLSRTIGYSRYHIIFSYKKTY